MEQDESGDHPNEMGTLHEQLAYQKQRNAEITGELDLLRVSNARLHAVVTALQSNGTAYSGFSSDENPYEPDPELKTKRH